MNSWLILTAVLAIAEAQDIIQPQICSSQYVNYYKLPENSSHITCMNFPIETFCIPGEVNNVESLILDFTSCSTQTTDWIPTGLFQKNNQIQRLHIQAFAPDGSPPIKSLRNDTFGNLQRLSELTLEGFERIRYLDPDLFRPLVKLKKLRLIGFGGQFLTYRQLGDALFGLSNSSLEEITMDSVHSVANKEKTLDMNILFRISGVNITSLVLINNDFNAVTGYLSDALPYLRYFECSMYFLTFSAMNFGLDSLIFLQHLEEVNYSFQINGDNPWSLGRRRRDDKILVLLDERTLKYYKSLTQSNDCYYGVRLKFNPTIRKAVISNMDFFRADPNVDVCFDESNNIEYLDFFHSPIGMIPGTLRGLERLRFFNLQKTSMNSISCSLFHDMPNLEILSLGDNNIGASVAADADGSLFKFQNRSLRSLDLSGSEISFIPKSMFSELSALQFLNLSRNIIESFQVKLPPSGNLSLLNLSDNSIRILTFEMISELESLQNSDDNRPILTFDLSRNSLSCLCNATDFVIWMKSTKKVSFESIDKYTCLHPNGTKVSVNSLNMTELMSDCKYLRQLPTTCPCAGLDYKRVKQMSLSLRDIYCTNDGKNLSYSDLVTNVNKTLAEYWWCKGVIENPIYNSPKFIVPLVIGFLLLLLLGVALIVIYKKRYTPKDVARMMQCMDLRPYIMHFIQYLSNHPAYTSENYEFDVFVYFQADDGPWVRKVLLEKLQHLKVITPDNFRIGAAMADAILDGCRKSRVVVLVLSSSFKRDDWCREITLRSYTSHPGSVIPVVINNTNLSYFDDDPLFSHLIATHCPIDLSSADSFIWKKFKSRVDNIRQSSNLLN